MNGIVLLYISCLAVQGKPYVACSQSYSVTDQYKTMKECEIAKIKAVHRYERVDYDKNEIEVFEHASPSVCFELKPKSKKVSTYKIIEIKKP